MSRGKGRPLRSNVQSSTRIEVRTTPTEFEAIRLEAEKRGISRGEFIRRRIFGTDNVEKAK